MRRRAVLIVEYEAYEADALDAEWWENRIGEFRKPIVEVQEDRAFP